MSNPEERSVIIKILSLYLFSTAIFLSVFFGFYYHRGYGLILHSKINDLRQDYVAIKDVIDRFGRFDETALQEMQTLGLNTNFAIYDKSGKLLYDNLGIALPKKGFRQNGFGLSEGYVLMDFTPYKIHSHFKNEKSLPSFDYLFITKEFDEAVLLGLASPLFDYEVIIKGDYIIPDIWRLRFKSIAFLALFLIGVGVVAYFLLKFSLKPLKDKIAFLNRFIKDTTHEINTPISVILMSIERLDQKNLSPENTKKINRIQIGAKTIANIYQNLVFYNFSKNQKLKSHLNIKEILEERLEFFAPLLGQKSLEIHTSLKPVFIEMDKNGFLCIIDNLLSNAIKYNKKGGRIDITLEDSYLEIKDSGYGIPKEKLPFIFQRYIRYESSQGGFGIGLALVKEICEDYDIKIKCESQLEEGSSFKLFWKKNLPFLQCE